MPLYYDITSVQYPPGDGPVAGGPAMRQIYYAIYSVVK